MPTTSSGRSLTMFGMLAATLVVTVASAFLLIPEHSRNGKFNLSLAAIVLAEFLLFLWPMWLNSGGATAAMPVHFALAWLSWVYLLVVAALAWWALTSDVSLNVLAVLHLSAFLVVLLVWGGSQMAAGRIDVSHAGLSARQAGFQTSRERFEQLSDRIQLIRSPDVAALQKSFRKMRDDLRYCGAETLPGAEAVEGELLASLAALEKSIDTLESAVLENHPGEAAGESTALEAWLQQFRLLLRRREERLRAVR